MFAGERDWNQSHVYRMIQETKKETRQTQQGQGPPQTTTTYQTKETRQTQQGQGPPHTTTTYQTSQKSYSYTPTIEDGYGISDF